MNLAYAKKLGLILPETTVRVQKINGFLLKIHSIILASFLLQDSQKRVRFFKKTFLLASISMEIVLKMSFLAFSNRNVKFTELKKLSQRSYITPKALFTISQVELINKKQFARKALDENSKTSVMNATALEVSTVISIHFSRTSKVYGLNKSTLVTMQRNKAFIKILAEYSDYADIFSINRTIKLLENTGIKKHAIELIERKQLPYWLIYILNPVELETLKAYLKTHLKTRFIQPFKSPESAPNFFDKKPEGSLCLCVDY